MSKNKIITIVAVLVVVLLGGWWLFGGKNSSTDTKQTASGAGVNVLNKQTTISTATSTDSAFGQNPGDISDDSIKQDLSNIDASLKVLVTDNSSLDQGLNDQAIPQVEN